MKLLVLLFLPTLALARPNDAAVPQEDFATPVKVVCSDAMILEHEPVADRVKRSDDDLPVLFASRQKREASTSESAESQLRVEREDPYPELTKALQSATLVELVKTSDLESARQKRATDEGRSLCDELHCQPEKRSVSMAASDEIEIPARQKRAADGDLDSHSVNAEYLSSNEVEIPARRKRAADRSVPPDQRLSSNEVEIPARRKRAVVGSGEWTPPVPMSSDEVEIPARRKREAATTEASRAFRYMKRTVDDEPAAEPVKDTTAPPQTRTDDVQSSEEEEETTTTDKRAPKRDEQ